MHRHHGSHWNVRRIDGGVRVKESWKHSREGAPAMIMETVCGDCGTVSATRKIDDKCMQCVNDEKYSKGKSPIVKNLRLLQEKLELEKEDWFDE